MLELGHSERAGWHERGRGRHRVPTLFYATKNLTPL
jgi:hypothetical protein